MVSLNSDYTALGVKAARTMHRLLNGTREVNTALQNCKEEAAIYMVV